MLLYADLSKIALRTFVKHSRSSLLILKLELSRESEVLDSDDPHELWMVTVELMLRVSGLLIMFPLLHLRCSLMELL